MTSFRYRAVHKSGEIRQGSLAVTHEKELIDILQSSGLELISARIEKKKFKNLVATEKQSVTLQRQILCSHMADLLQAGLPLLNCLQEIANIMPNGALADALRLIARDTAQGDKLTDAFAKHGNLFDSVFLALLQAGESSGDLVVTFRHLAEHLRWQDRVARHLRHALRYPLFLLLVAVATTSFMMTMVVPQIIGFLNTINGNLPFSTRALIAVADAFSTCWLFALTGLVLFVFLFVVLRRQSHSFALKTDRWLLAFPFIGQPLLQLLVARFTETFAMLLKSGLSLPESLRIARPVLRNRFLMAVATEAEQQVQSGVSLSEATRLIFPAFVTQMLRIGEQSGQLPKALADITRTYDERVKEIVDRFIGSLEPLLTLLIGGLLAWVVLAVLGPIYGSLGQLGQSS